MAVFDDDKLIKPVVENYVKTKHFKQPYVPFPEGTIAGKCKTLPEHGWVDKFMPGWNLDLTTKAFRSVRPESYIAPSNPKHPTHKSDSNETDNNNNNLICHEYIDHKVLMLERDTFANFWHDSEDFLNAFLAMAILDWTPGDTQVYLMDLYPQGPFWEIWLEVFSWGKVATSATTPATTTTTDNDKNTYSDSSYPPKYVTDDTLPVRTAYHLKQDFGTITGRPSRMHGHMRQIKRKKPNSHHDGDNDAYVLESTLPVPEYRVCYRDLAVGIYGPASPVTVASWKTPCSHTALVRAYSDFIIRGMNLQSSSHYASAKPSQEIVITYMARRPSTVWPEKRFCDDKRSFFLCKLWDTFGIRPLKQQMQNDDELVECLKSLENREYSNGASVKFNDQDFNLLTIREQIKQDLGTDILIGPHGAGLTHTTFLRDRGVVIELLVDGNQHFHNLAKWAGKKYVHGPGGNPVDLKKLESTVVREIEAMDLNTY